MIKPGKTYKACHTVSFQDYGNFKTFLTDATDKNVLICISLKTFLKRCFFSLVFKFSCSQLQLCLSFYSFEYYVSVFTWKPWSFSCLDFIAPEASESFSQCEALSGFASFRHISVQENLNANFVHLNSVSASEGWSNTGKIWNELWSMLNCSLWDSGSRMPLIFGS